MKILLILCAFMLFPINSYAMDKMDCEEVVLHGFTHILRCENLETVCYISRYVKNSSISCKFK